MKYFYDIHCHVTDLSHPCLYAFMRRFTPWINTPVIGSIVGALAPIFWMFNKDRSTNLLSFMERDVGAMLEEMERAYPQPLTINGQTFDKIIVNPLLVDFWATLPQIDPIAYQFKPKSIIPQTEDILDGIRAFTQKNPPGRMSAIPFMGLNTVYCYLPGRQNTLENTDLNDLLNKYFPQNAPVHYPQNRDALVRNNGQFGGDLGDPGLRPMPNLFAGIKVYPPLGFDPWPSDPHELDKVKYLYQVCQERRIPIISHSSPGGYQIFDKMTHETLAFPGKWFPVLKNFPDLRLDLAHFGGFEQLAAYSNHPGTEYRKWTSEIVSLMEKNQYVYTDIAYCGHDEKGYEALARVFGKKPLLVEKVLFGSDLSINLLDSPSYQDYLDKFMRTTSITPAQKEKICNANPERFLWQ